ncbi:hypothetical protein [Marinimicrobium alkaliphilum]|uniref:hypothetical protein n=1 Tax=Marinimicrobium alkaliphilum TaxID=2202654 RepID=UPI000DBA6D39|nr:hypothetical protein [Marinimicrobium alkaliphilum]
MRKLLMVYAAGSLGALVAFLVAWFAGQNGIPQAFGVRLAPTLAGIWSYSGLVWGGLWGLVFMIPILRGSLFLRSFFLALIPAGVFLFFYFPYHTHGGLFGLNWGTLTPLFVIVYCWVWSLVTALTLRFARAY